MEKIIDTYRNHSRFRAIKTSVTRNRKYNLPHATTQNINEIINAINSGKATSPDGIPVESIKLSVNAIDSHVANTTNKYKDLNSYSKNAKIAKVRPIFKEDERTKNLNVFSKIFEKFTHYSLISFVFFFSEFISAYRKTCSTNMY